MEQATRAGTFVLLTIALFTGGCDQSAAVSAGGNGPGVRTAADALQINDIGPLIEDLVAPARLALRREGRNDLGPARASQVSNRHLLAGTLPDLPGTGVGSGKFQVLVADAQANAVVRFDASSGEHLGTWSEPAGPVGIAVHADGRIFVSRRDDAQVGVYNPVFRFQYLLADGVISFVKPTDLAVDSSGRIYVVDSGADLLYVFNGDESLAFAIGGRGEDPGEFKVPSAVAIDPSSGRIIVADQENSRIQGFDSAGTPLFQFGYLMKYTGGGAEGWMPRSAGLAVDDGGNIYVADALMGTLRIFDREGAELGKVLDYGFETGQLRTPCDVVIDEGRGVLFLANSAAGQVEVYGVEGPEGLRGVLGTFYSGTNGSADSESEESSEFSGFVGWHAPHMQEDLHCARCHGVNDLPGGHEGRVEGQANLCFSCHTSGGQAPGQLFLADGSDSHAWGVLAESTLHGSDGPSAGGPLEDHLDGGDIKCATCHDQHSAVGGEPYLRMNTKDSQLCGDCHRQEAQWQNAGHSDWSSRAFTYPVGEGHEECVHCHSGLGYIDFANGVPEEDRNTGVQVHSCVVCHATHGSTDPALVRVFDNVTLPGDFEVTDADTSATCMVCHNGRRAPEEGGLPHYALGGATLVGINGVDYGYGLFNSFHTGNVLCVRCHMAETPADGVPGHDKLGGHSWNMVVHNEGQPDDGAENAANACSPCHSIDEYNELVRDDFDGDGDEEGVQDEVEDLLLMVFNSLHDAGAVFLGHYPYWDFSGVDDDPPGRLQDVKDAAWNYEVVDNDGSKGVHNTSYSVGLLQVTFIVLDEQPVPPWDTRFFPP